MKTVPCVVAALLALTACGQAETTPAPPPTPVAVSWSVTNGQLTCSGADWTRSNVFTDGSVVTTCRWSCGSYAAQWPGDPSTAAGFVSLEIQFLPQQAPDWHLISETAAQGCSGSR